MTAKVTTKSSENLHVINWPTSKVLAFSTTRHFPTINLQHLHSKTAIQLNNTELYSKAFDYFNLGDHVGDNPISVKNNRNALLTLLPNGAKIQWLEQVHGNHVAYIDKVNETPIIADSAITREKSIALAIMTADCLPILLADKNGHEIAAIHAGWRPLAKNIIANTLSKMTSKNKDIHAWLGPCIGVSNFEVGAEVRQAFCQLSQKLSCFFIASSSDKYQADLIGLATSMLEMSGVASIMQYKACTFAQKNKFYSYRRDHKTGRMASIICLNK